MREIEKSEEFYQCLKTIIEFKNCIITECLKGKDGEVIMDTEKYNILWQCFDIILWKYHYSKKEI